MKYLREFGVIRGIGYSMVVMAMTLAIGATFGSGAASKRQLIEISLPDLSRFQNKPCSADDPIPCAAEAAALGAALAELEIAREVAEEAYQAWVDCVDANGGPSPEPNPNPPPRTVGLTSVLEATK